MEINEYDLKERHSDELIGCYTTEGGYGHFIDLRGSEGEVVRTFYESGIKLKSDMIIMGWLSMSFIDLSGIWLLLVH